MAEAEIFEEFADLADEAGVAEAGAESSAGIARITEEVYKDAQTEEMETAKEQMENVETALESGKIDLSKDYGGQEEEVQKQLEHKRDIYNNFNEIFKSKYPDFKLDPELDLEENFPEGSDNYKALKEYNESIKSKFEGKEQELREKAETETDPKKREALKRTAGYVAAVVTLGATAVVACLQALADAESGCYQYKSGREKKLNCGTSKIDTLKGFCKCPVTMTELQSHCPTVEDDATCDKGYIYYTKKKWWWNEFGELLVDAKTAAENIGGDIQKLIDIFLKYWWVILIVVPLLGALIMGLVNQRKKMSTST